MNKKLVKFGSYKIVPIFKKFLVKSTKILSSVLLKEVMSHH